MSGRIDELPENALADTLNKAEALANELKSRQLVSGGNIRFFTSESDDQYDWQGSLVAGGQYPGAGKKIFRVTATAKNMDNLFADLILEIYKSDGTMWTYADYWAAIVNNTEPRFYRILYEEPVAIADSNKKVWSVGITGLAGQQAKLKWYVVASDEVTIDFVEI
jgi:hypothetical protein